MNQVVVPHGQSGQTVLQVPAAFVVMPTATEFVAAVLATILALLGYAYGGDLAGITNLLVPTIVTLSVSWGAIQIVYRDKSGIWTPLFWSRVALAVYFGVGSLVPYLANAETREFMQTFYLFFNEDVAKYNLIICCFVLVFTSSIYLILTLPGKNRSEKHFVASGLDQKAVGLLTLIIGLLVHVLVLVPVSIGLYQIEITSSISLLAQLIYVGIFLLSSVYFRQNSYSIYLLAALCFLLFLFGLIELNKSITIFPIAVFFLGYIYERFSFRRAVIVFVTIFSLYLAITPVVSAAREGSGFTGEASAVIPVEKRVSALLEYVGEGDQANDSGVQGGWSRLSYVNAATFAASEYDLGRPGNSLRDIFVIWVPRALYPDKPEITALGREFNYAATGNDQSQSNPGLVAEGYWTNGWLGVVLFGVGLAMIFTYWSLYSIAVLRSDAWHLFFVVLLGMRTGIRMDGLLVPDIIGPIGFAVLGHIALQFLNRLLIERRVQDGPAATA